MSYTTNRQPQGILNDDEIYSFSRTLKKLGS
jgi:hypothetical protein